VVKTYLTPGWVGLTVLFWAAAVTMVLLGRWQLMVSNRKHFDLQNFGYSLQWWAFSLCALVFWAKFVRDAWRRPATVASSGGQLAVRSAGLTPVGPTQLVAPARPDGAPAVVYRGYVMPKSGEHPTRSEGDPVHGAYNDYLWQLALADAQEPHPIIRPPRAEPADDRPSPSALEAGEH
jgi:hypothetical protein